MPTISVAPVYTDPWAKTTFEAQAIVAEKPYWSRTVTLLGVTCSEYWVRFFYTEINLLRWVQDSAITTWAALETRYIPITTAFTAFAFSTYRNECRVLSPVASSQNDNIFCGLTMLRDSDSIVAAGCSIALHTSLYVTSLCRIALLSQASTTPWTAAATLLDAHTHTLSLTYIDYTPTLATPHTPLQGESLSLLIQLYHGVSVGPAVYSYVKDPHVIVARSI